MFLDVLLNNLTKFARVVELADTGDLKSPALWRAGSNPASGTKCLHGEIGKRTGFRDQRKETSLQVRLLLETPDVLVVELADTQDLGSCAERRERSNRSKDTINHRLNV